MLEVFVPCWASPLVSDRLEVSDLLASPSVLGPSSVSDPDPSHADRFDVPFRVPSGVRIRPRPGQDPFFRHRHPLGVCIRPRPGQDPFFRHHHLSRCRSYARRSRPSQRDRIAREGRVFASFDLSGPLYTLTLRSQAFSGRACP